MNMSFPRAKRFETRVSDINVSPADYDLRVDPDNTVRFGTCPRFHNTVPKEGPPVECSRPNCCSKLEMTCSTPNVSNKRRQSNTVRSESVRSSRLSFPSENDEVSSSEHREDCQENIKNDEVLLDVIDNPPKPPGSLIRQNSLDNDTRSLANSKESNTIDKKRKIQSNEVNNRNQIEIQENESGQGGDDQIRKCGGKMIKIKKVTTFLIPENKVMLIPYNEIANVVSTAMNDLHVELQNKRRSVLNETNEKVEHLISEIYTMNISFKKDIKRLTDSTSANLIKQITNILNGTNGSVSGPSADIDTELEEIERLPEIQDASFNYENIFRVLSEQLQNSKDELDAIGQQIDATLDTQRRLDRQESILNFIGNEITNWKKDISKDD
ncbi:uncharacterized protein [Leptinotarsa decemlineata]|uniref:uncharacterized protein n=1 Tax=Leptinotarsa decemlineata TaxID=7539 RepID=UPI000C252EFC|nr:uncharacterized protein LOC111505530 [Leptinotarsa decemlineata]